MQGGRVAARHNVCTQPRTIPTIQWTWSFGRKACYQPHWRSIQRKRSALMAPVDTRRVATEPPAEVAEGEDKDKDEGFIDWRQRWSAPPNTLLDPFLS
jgi:hypothetical protein